MVANESGYADVIVPDYTEWLAQGYYVGFVLSAFVYSTSVRSNPIGTAPNSVNGSLRILYDNLGSETSASVRVTLIYVKQNKVITV